ncbi:MAG: cell division protein SepF [Candidatus Aenigmarchaeota archaeon]|nr:cell division protein SepF [Candidatus Aenigmarchaeota archaeon]
MVIGKLKKKLKKGKIEVTKNTEEFLELGEEFFKFEKSVGVKIENLKSYSDTERIQQLLREGNIIFLKIRELRSKDITELKRAIQKLKRTCMALDGDIVGVDEDYIILTPSFAKIFRG